MPNPPPRPFQNRHWRKAVKLFEGYLKQPLKSDQLFNQYLSDTDPVGRRLCQFLVFGTIRNLDLINWILNRLLIRESRARLKSILFIGTFELLVRDVDFHPKIVHFVVSQSHKLVSRPETRLVNAVLRRAAGSISRQEWSSLPDLERLSLQFSHPLWMVLRWIDRFGREDTESFLKWNQQPPPVYLCAPGFTGSSVSPHLESTTWPNFYRMVKSETSQGESLIDPELLVQGGYITDPLNRLPIELLSPQKNEKVLDLCAAPGGKSWQIAQVLIKGQGLLVSIDRPGGRIPKLRENLSPFESSRYCILERDVLALTEDDFTANKLPSCFDGVLVDVPCSNTGVLRRRPDARWRLKEKTIALLPGKQLELLEKAATFVKENGGRLVYSTCSIEPEENERVVESFLKAPVGKHFRMIESRKSLPWQDKHDGGGAFLLRRD